MMEKFKRFGQMLGLGAMMAAGSPEVMAAPAAPQKVEAEDASTVAWAKESVDVCEGRLKEAKDGAQAEEIVLRCRQSIVQQFYFPHGATVEAAMTPMVLNAAEASALVKQIDRLDAMMKTVDAKYGTTTFADSKEQLDDMRLKARRAADPTHQGRVRALEELR